MQEEKGGEKTEPNQYVALLNDVYKKEEKDEKENRKSVIEKKQHKYGEEQDRLFINLENEFGRHQIKQVYGDKIIELKNPDNPRHVLVLKPKKEKDGAFLLRISIKIKNEKVPTKNLGQYQYVKSSKSKFPRDPENYVDFLIQLLAIQKEFIQKGLYSNYDFQRTFLIDGNGELGFTVLMFPQFAYLEKYLNELDDLMKWNPKNFGKLDENENDSKAVHQAEVRLKFINIPYLWLGLAVLILLHERTLKKMGLNLENIENQDAKQRPFLTNLKKVVDHYSRRAIKYLDRVDQISKSESIVEDVYKCTSLQNLRNNLRLIERQKTVNKKGHKLIEKLIRALKNLIYLSVWDTALPRLFSINLIKCGNNSKEVHENISILKTFMTNSKDKPDFELVFDVFGHAVSRLNQNLIDNLQDIQWLKNKNQMFYEIPERAIKDEITTFQLKLKHYPIKYSFDTNPKEFQIHVEYLEKKNILCVRTKIPELVIVVENYDDLAFLFQYITTKEEQFSIEVDENRKISIRITSCPGFDLNFFNLLMRSIDRSLLLAVHIYSYYTNVWLSSGNKPSKDYEHYENVYNRIKKDMQALNTELDNCLSKFETIKFESNKMEVEI